MDSISIPFHIYCQPVLSYSRPPILLNWLKKEVRISGIGLQQVGSFLPNQVYSVSSGDVKSHQLVTWNIMACILPLHQPKPEPKKTQNSHLIWQFPSDEGRMLFSVPQGCIFIYAYQCMSVWNNNIWTPGSERLHCKWLGWSPLCGSPPLPPNPSMACATLPPNPPQHALPSHPTPCGLCPSCPTSLQHVLSPCPTP